MAPQIVSVGQVNLYIKELLNNDPLLSDVWVKGELSNYKAHSSGHHYFTMKDDVGSIRCVMFKGVASKLIFKPNSGMTVIVRGKVSLFERDGQYQLYIAEMQPDGIGAAQLALEQLKRELQEKGLLEQSRKQPIPKFPKVVGVITSPTGAAWQDIQKVAFSRYKGVHLALYPATVQGENAPREISEAIKLANIHNYADVLIVGRGGGSIEDMWCFNSREVAYAIAESHIPIVSAVGHEIDFTVADLVADLRAATPSAAAEIVVPSAMELLSYLDHAQTRLLNVSGAYIRRANDALDDLASRKVMTNPETIIEERWLLIDSLTEKMTKLVETKMSTSREEFLLLARALDLLNPASIFARGYSITYDKAGNIIKDASKINPGDNITTRLDSGKLECIVVKKECVR